MTGTPTPGTPGIATYRGAPSYRGAPTYRGAGMILFTYDKDNNEQFLLLEGRSGCWSFPKGHAELCDDNEPLKTAVRETFEETGFVVGQDYTIFGRSMVFGKHFYWVGKLNRNHNKTEPVQLNSSEHTNYRWATRSQIKEMLVQNNMCANGDIRDWVKKTMVRTDIQYNHILKFIACYPQKTQTQWRPKQRQPIY